MAIDTKITIRLKKYAYMMIVKSKYGMVIFSLVSVQLPTSPPANKKTVIVMLHATRTMVSGFLITFCALINHLMFICSRKIPFSSPVWVAMSLAALSAA